MALEKSPVRSYVGHVHAVMRMFQCATSKWPAPATCKVAAGQDHDHVILHSAYQLALLLHLASKMPYWPHVILHDMSLLIWCPRRSPCLIEGTNCLPIGQSSIVTESIYQQNNNLTVSVL